jgi:hypothetical protein
MSDVLIKTGVTLLLGAMTIGGVGIVLILAGISCDVWSSWLQK